MYKVVIAHHKPVNAPHACTSQVSTKWVRTPTLQLATAHRNLRSNIASHALEDTKVFTSAITLNKQWYTSPVVSIFDTGMLKQIFATPNR